MIITDSDVKPSAEAEYETIATDHKSRTTNNSHDVTMDANPSYQATN